MGWLLVISSCLVLGLIAWFDFKYRYIPVVLLIIEPLLVFSYYNWVSEIPLYTTFISVNIALILLNISILFVWFRWFRDYNSFFDNVLGWGDVIMFMIAALFFSPLNYLLFIVISGLAGGIVHFLPTLKIRAKGDNSALIPLAGIMATLLIGVQIIHSVGYDLFTTWPIMSLY